MTDLHQMIINHHSQMIGWESIAFQDYLVFDLSTLDCYGSTNQVIQPEGFLVLRNLYADDMLFT